MCGGDKQENILYNLLKSGVFNISDGYCGGVSFFFTNFIFHNVDKPHSDSWAPDSIQSSFSDSK